MTARASTVTDVPPLAGDSYGWDWTATTHDAEAQGLGTSQVAHTLLRVMDPTHVLPGKGLQGWRRSAVAYDADGYKLGAVYWGGDRGDVHVVATSDAADLVRPRVAGLYEAKTARVDTRVDTKVTFNDLVALARDVAGPRTKVTYMESHVGDESTGRTLYVGAPTSNVRVRIYEKWLESPNQYEEGTNRVEVQLRPPSRGKQLVSEWLPGETFCASKLTRRLAEELGENIYKPGTLQKRKGTPDLEQSLRAMGEQYGGVVDRFLSRTGGDVNTVVAYLTGNKGA